MSQSNALPPNFIPFQVGKKDDFDLKAVLFAYLKKWPWIVLGMLAGALAALYINASSSPIYKVNSSVIIKDDKPSLGADIFGPAGYRNFQARYELENELGILSSFSLAEETLSQLSFNTQYFREGKWRNTMVYANVPVEIKADWKHPQMVGGMLKLRVLDDENFEISVLNPAFSLFNPLDPFYKTPVNLPENAIEGMHAFGEVLNGQHYKFTVTNLFASPGEELLFFFRDTPSLALYFKESIQVNPLSNISSVIQLSINSPVRRMGQDYLNTLMETYLRRELREKNEVTESTIFFINEQLNDISDSLTYFENELETFRTKNRVFNLSEEGTQIFTRLQEMEQERSEAAIRLSYYMRLKDYLENGELDDLIAPSIAEEGDPLLNALVVGLSELQAEKIRLSANYASQTPVIREVETKIESTKKALIENIHSAIGNLESVLEEMDQKLAATEQEVSKLPETEKVLLGLKRQFSINENIYIYLLEKRAESEITLASNKPSNQILDQAMASPVPIAPRRRINLLIGLLLGFFVPVFWITLRNFLYTKVNDPRQLERSLEIPLVGMIGRHSKNEAKPVLTSPRSPVAESFRGLRADVPYLSSKKERLTLLFTSTVSGEGKTFISINMASVYALMGKKTILIGLDLRKPKIAEDFGLKNDKGMSTCLSTGTPWVEAIKPSGYENLDVLLSGPIPPNPAELLLQENFRAIMEDIQSSYEVVILDCPPVGLVSETKELMQYADINFFIFRQKYSELSNAQLCNNLNAKGGVKKLYAVLNDVHVAHAYGYQYGYQYGYADSYGYHDMEKKSWWKRHFRS
jgi:capsular exopolysaccharide synthesis family protein